ncbi:MAG: helix-turn-helix domain-containing protein, partial [Pseudomonadota bacterium]
FAVRYHDEMMGEGGARGAETPDRVTPREREALHWTAEGLTTEATAARLGLTPSAVNYHLRNACRKLSASSKQHAAIKALRLGLID